MTEKKSNHVTLEAAPLVHEIGKPVLEFKQYRRSQIAELAPWHDRVDMSKVLISDADLLAGSPKVGDMVARNPKNHADMWLVSAQHFADNFEPLPIVLTGDVTLTTSNHIEIKDGNYRPKTAKIEGKPPKHKK